MCANFSLEDGCAVQNGVRRMILNNFSEDGQQEELVAYLQNMQEQTRRKTASSRTVLWSTGGVDFPAAAAD